MIVVRLRRYMLNFNELQIKQEDSAYPYGRHCAYIHRAHYVFECFCAYIFPAAKIEYGRNNQRLLSVIFLDTLIVLILYRTSI